MKRRRRGAGAANVEDVEDEVVADGAREADAAEAQPEPATDRRANMATVARKRAAHFAHYQAADEGEDNLHTGGQEARSLGMWASSVQLIEGRADAAAARREKMLAAEKAAKAANKEIKWAPKRDFSLGRRPSKRVPSLFNLTCRLLAQHLEDIETLWGIDDMIRVQLSTLAARGRKLTPDTIRLFTAHAPEMVVLPDCTSVEQAGLAQALAECATPGLSRLELGMCGRGLGDAVVKSIAALGQLQKLRALCLGGAYCLRDTGLEAFLAQAPGLEELRLPHCSRIVGVWLPRLPKLCPSLRVLDLADCRGIDGEALLQALQAGLPNLATLFLDGVMEVTDEWLGRAAPKLAHLRELSISHCSAVTDLGVAAVAMACPKLTMLRANGVTRLTDAALVALAEGCRHLHDVSLQDCSKISNTGVVALAQKGRLKRLCLNRVPLVGPASVRALSTSCADTLEDLDLSWNHGLPADAIGLLADSCSNLRRLAVFGCNQVDGRILFGHSNDGLEIVGAPCERQAPMSCAAAVIVADE